MSRTTRLNYRPGQRPRNCSLPDPVAMARARGLTPSGLLPYRRVSLGASLGDNLRKGERHAHVQR